MKILITAPYNEEGQRVLAATFGEIIYKPWKPHGRAYNEQELTELLHNTRADALITEHDHVTAKVIEAFPILNLLASAAALRRMFLWKPRRTRVSRFFTPPRGMRKPWPKCLLPM